VLKLILQLGQVGNNALALIGLLTIVNADNSAVKIIYGASLSCHTSQRLTLVIDCPVQAHEDDRPALVGRDRGEARLIGCEILSCTH
jgi:hypothetical protein